ncbi:MAG: sensor histidine kinase [Chloroflexi bacterium]|nr:sensor histidine kinase [Chloroflexota bacterium]
MKPQPDTPPRYFRLAFTLMYMGIITAVIYFNLISQCSNRFLFSNTTALVAILLFLLGIERFEHTHFDVRPSRRAALTLLFTRMALLEAVALLDCSGFSGFLYPVIPFTAYFSLGDKTSNLLGLLYTAVFVGKLWLLDSAWYANVDIMSNLLIFIVVMIFMQMMARVIFQDEANKREMERLLADFEATNRRLQAYAAQVAELATTEERNRLARDIHDSLGHYLTAVNIQLEKALAYRNRSPEEAEQAIRDAKQSASEALQDVRRSVGALRSEGERFSLRQSLQQLVKGMDDGRFTINLAIAGYETGYSRPALMALYRVAQEGLTNIHKHAQASQVAVEVQLGETEASLCLRDDGRGFDTAMIEDWIAAPHDTFGLQGIRERLELVRGEMKLTSNTEEGTRLFVTVPKKI